MGPSCQWERMDRRSPLKLLRELVMDVILVYFDVLPQFLTHRSLLALAEEGQHGIRFVLIAAPKTS